ncbi:MAG: DUF5360 family protein [Alphaproteobacteria bacterium]
MLITDIGFILYWSLSALMLISVEIVPPEQMFKDYENYLLQVWNWSFAPLDIVLSAIGLLAVRRAVRGESWQGLAVISLTLTFTAGLMAISFWAVKGDFDVVWWGMNSFLMLWPLLYLPSLVNRSP